MPFIQTKMSYLDDIFRNWWQEPIYFTEKYNAAEYLTTQGASPSVVINYSRSEF